MISPKFTRIVWGSPFFFSGRNRTECNSELKQITPMATVDQRGAKGLAKMREFIFKTTTAITSRLHDPHTLKLLQAATSSAMDRRPRNFIELAAWIMFSRVVKEITKAPELIGVVSRFIHLEEGAILRGLESVFGTHGMGVVRQTVAVFGDHPHMVRLWGRLQVNLMYGVHDPSLLPHHRYFRQIRRYIDTNDEFAGSADFWNGINLSTLAMWCSQASDFVGRYIPSLGNVLKSPTTTNGIPPFP